MREHTFTKDECITFLSCAFFFLFFPRRKTCILLIENLIGVFYLGIIFHFAVEYLLLLQFLLDPFGTLIINVVGEFHLNHLYISEKQSGHVIILNQVW